MNRALRVAAALGTPLLWSNGLLPRLGLDVRGRTVANASAATVYAFAFAARPNWISVRGLRYGLGCASAVAVGYGAAVAFPTTRRIISGFGNRAPEVGAAEWIALHIPVGTVYSEELIFRGTLNPLLISAFGPRLGMVTGAVAFGLWHIHPARVAGDSVTATIAFTSCTGLLFGWLRRHTDSATAPALLHWAVNAGGVIAARASTPINTAGASREG
ncbi:CPBP family intramembrane glutamic endopeptidase [Nocardia donostiensis]|uniref:CAAX protease family protein n=1 Tax=Nocardia donostiensis TaxID=1538463 RepID=A0A1V2TJH0_9NOCA|nr:type II CAAX endopeptidase family protein [Nocardia donostiensis]ONM49618.1 CAAX protease family protein [Nocardia donostiensis]OQS12910.1 CAAX protease family protein [Nocardia donostiensis]OQS19239.1 CAAX protease family protein [Nocardia donostiensis]